MNLIDILKNISFELSLVRASILFFVSIGKATYHDKQLLKHIIFLEEFLNDFLKEYFNFYIPTFSNSIEDLNKFKKSVLMYCKTLENFVNTIPSSVDEIASKHNWVELIGIRPFEIKEKTDDETHDI